MSRLIIKNLPNSMTDARLRQQCAAFGTVTDCRVRRDSAGKSRRFGFLGFSSDESARQALAALNGSYVGTSRVTVEVCKPLGQSTGSGRKKASQNAERQPQGGSSAAKGKTPAKKGKATGALEQVQADSGFSEFLEAHVHRGDASFWGNDDVLTRRPQPGDDEDDDDDGGDGKDGDGKARKEEVKAANMRELSDREYLRTKVVKTLVSDDEGNEEKEEEGKSDDAGGGGGGRKSDSDYETGGEGGTRVEKKKRRRRKPAEEVLEPEPVFTAKLRGVPFNIKEDRVREFFLPLVAESVRIATTKHGSRTGYVFVDFKSEQDLREALKRNKEYMGKRYIEVMRDVKPLPPGNKPLPPGSKPLPSGGPAPDVSESGRLFVRNLPYTCCQQDLEELFTQYGTVSDTRVPVDTMCGRPKGFALVTFSRPEDAVRAMAALDGSVFQGRMLHILPAQERKEEDVGAEGAAPTSSTSSYKRDKEKRDKASSHNWNALFLGVNAVADAIAATYGTSKRRVLDHETEGSAAVRLALGEADIVADTRRFLQEAGVRLDAFGQAATSRSDRVFLVKNLPASADFSDDDLCAVTVARDDDEDDEDDEEEAGAGGGDARARALRALVSRAAGRGALSRLLLPPRGLTAIAEFARPHDAKRAFTRLAYRKFKSVPLFLEWAPMDVFGTGSPEVRGQPDAGVAEVAGGHDPRRPPQPEKWRDEEEGDEVGAAAEAQPALGVKDAKPGRGDDDDGDDDEEEEDAPLPGCTIFVKNLNLVTTEDTLQQVFSKCGKLRSCSVSRKTSKSGEKLSMGYGFVEFREPAAAKKALKNLQHAMVDENKVQLKISERATRAPSGPPRAPRDPAAPPPTRCSKLLVRNVPFQASANEIRELFSTFGELRSVRLPRKPGAGTSHRGFAFVDFISTRAARRAMTSLCTSTHLYGRRLVVEFAAEGADRDLDTARRKSTLPGSSAPKKRHSELLDDILRMVEGGEGGEGEEEDT